MSENKDIGIPQRMAAFSAALEEIQKTIEKMGGSIMPDRLTFDAVGSGDRGMIVGFRLYFDVSQLHEYAAQPKGQGRDASSLPAGNGGKKPVIVDVVVNGEGLTLDLTDCL